jgi:hypothetical protein
MGDPQHANEVLVNPHKHRGDACAKLTTTNNGRKDGLLHSLLVSRTRSSLTIKQFS